MVEFIPGKVEKKPLAAGVLNIFGQFIKTLPQACLCHPKEKKITILLCL